MTAGGRRVTVCAKTTVVSMTPVRQGKTYPLSALDHAMGRHTLRLVFYYRPGPTMDKFKLKESLSEVLSQYPAVTGRLAREEEEEGGGHGGWVVKCNDAGVRLAEARASVTLDEWLRSADDEEEMELAYWEPMDADPFIWSPFYVQITEFEDKAIAIGLSCPHMHADPTCAILLVRAWSDAHRRACVVYPPFLHAPAFFPRPQPNPSSPLLSLKSSSTPATHTKGRMSSATFVFSDAAVKSCLTDAGLPLDSSPFDALAALFWTRIARASTPEPDAPLGLADLTLCIDFRKHMHAPLPHGFYGNAFHFYRTRADLGAGLEHVAAELRRHAAAIREEDFWEAVEWVHERRPGRREADPPFQMYGPELTCMQMDHQPFAYGAAFEKDGGRPAHVTCRVRGVEGAGLVLVMTAAEEGAARQVVVTLPEEVADRICQDDAIMKYVPVVMFAASAISRS
ncbi:protein ECERIFERUM 26-like [Musa acuminata AAA Group]|uniref:protein ECERIFERUM 26-like n=1 Tax=Musa acuminata AAA Group TaxID=214697 RepID=UPI0031D070F7